MKMKFSTQWEEYNDDARTFVEPSLTDESFAYSSDITNILNDFGVNTATSIPIDVIEKLGLSDENRSYDLGNHLNLSTLEWRNMLAIARRRWVDLTPEMKAQFPTPASFYKFASDPRNYVDEEEIDEEFSK